MVFPDPLFSPAVKNPNKRSCASPPPPSSRKKPKPKAVRDDDDLVPDHNQGISELRDVVSVSGVNLAEEQERMLLLSVPKKRQVSGKLELQEKQEGLVLERAALVKKLAQILGRCGLRVGVGKDVERCLAMCVEERLRGIICELIRQSKQRVGCEKSKHGTVCTSDVKQEIMVLNKKAREELEEKAINEAKVSGDGFNGVEENGDNGDDTMRRSRAAAANVAALAALGGHDILAKWQLKAAQLKDVNHKATSTVGRTMDGNVQVKKKGAVEGSLGIQFGRDCHVMMMPQTKVVSTRSITVKHVIAGLEKEPQMSKSTLIYLLMNTARR